MSFTRFPDKQGLYDPANEKDSCGVGLIANINGVPEHRIVTDALLILHRLCHRGACGAEENEGDGAGILMGLPHAFFQHHVSASLVPDEYAVGMFYLSRDLSQRDAAKKILTNLAALADLVITAWRTVPTNNADLGHAALDCEPWIEQVSSPFWLDCRHHSLTAPPQSISPFSGVYHALRHAVR